MVVVSMGNRYPVYGGYGMGYKDDEDWEDDEMMGERRGRRRKRFTTVICN